MWLVIGLQHFRGVLERVLAESYRLDREERAKTKNQRAALPAGHETEFEIRG